MKLVGRVLYDAETIVGPWVSQRIPIWSGWLPPNYRALGIVSGQTIVGGVVFYDFSRFNCQLAIAFDTPKAASREVFGALARFAFNGLGLMRATAIVGKDNRRVRRFLKGVGFVEEGSHRSLYGEKTVAISYGLLADECRWIGKHDYAVTPEPS